MTDYTRVNVREIEDQAPKFGMEGLEFRTARTVLGLSQSGFTYVRVDPGYRLPFGHRHSTQEEVYVLISGEARLKLDEEVLELTPFDAVRIDPGVMRNLEGGPEGAELPLYGAPQEDPSAVPTEQGWWSD
jgi:mannose-6-phosphate isomerase-like protein (cupin superfamily)